MRATFVLEQQVGHRTYYQNLRRFVDTDARIAARWAPITYSRPGGLVERLSLLPPRVRGSIRGRSQVIEALSGEDSDVTFFFTQVPAALCGGVRRKRPYVIATDITPLQYDQMAVEYGHKADRPGPVKTFKHMVNRSVFQQAASILPFSDWARQSLITDYGVDPARIEVIPSGVDVDMWHPNGPRSPGPPRILFVGGDFHRKGGEDLLAAFRDLPAGACELHIVTRSELEPEPGVVIHRGLSPNTPELIDVFRSCDVFVMPSKAEAFGHVVVEAGAVGLPCIVSDIGGMPEIVVDGQTGFVVPAGDRRALRGLLHDLAFDTARRERMSKAVRAHIVEHFNLRHTARRTIQHLYSATGDR